MSENKKKKKKVVYYEDGRTIADMSGLFGKGAEGEGEKKNSTPTSGEPSYKGDPYAFTKFRPGHGPKDWAKTYWNTVKTMFLPMLATLGIIAAAFLILWILLEIAS
ncbi:MAG: hypothetical protein J6V80_03955 [Clostridia bacterium]|nr:hypothetical protein [Clostridia bacterium]